jgi:hypothetical protein
MLLVPHTVTAIAIASVIKTPWALPLAFLSHFLVDIIPHWDPLIDPSWAKKKPEKWYKLLLFVAIDFLVALDIGLFFTWKALNTSSPDIRQASIVFFSCFLANVPDALLIPKTFLGKDWPWLKAYWDLHARIQTKLPLPWGVLVQVFLVAICLWLAL